MWAGLWTLPLYDDEAAARAPLAQSQIEVLPRIEHALTHFDWVLHTLKADGVPAAEVAGTWVARENLARYALPAPLKKLFEES